MEKIYKWIISLSITVITISIVYYVMIYLPKKDAENRLIKNEASCSVTEKNVLTQFFKESLVAIKENEISSQNHFSQFKNKCYVELTYTPSVCAGISCSSYKIIYDGIEFRTVADSDNEIGNSESGLNFYENDDNGTSTQISREEFDELEKDYMIR